MPVEITEVTKANLVLVNFEALNTEPGILRFLEEVKGFVSIGQRLDMALSLDIQSERISVVRTPDGRAIINRDYPAFLNDLNRLAEVAELVIANSDVPQDRYAFGFNVEAACTQRSEMPSSRYLAQRFFDLSGLSNDGMHDFVSSSWDMEFSDDEARWRISIRGLETPFASPNLYVTLNRHYQNQPLPDKRTIRNMLRETWNRIPKFIEKLEHAS